MRDQCHYEVHVKTAKEEMVRRIKSLEQQNAELQGSVKERDYQIEAIFEALKTGERGSEAIARLRSGQSYQEIVTWLGGPPVGDVGRLSPGSETRLADIVQDYDDSMRMDMGSQSPEAETRARWTFASPQLTDHLVALFFTWVHPIHMLFSEYYFMKSFSDGDRRYCSPALVNIMCAMGCFYHVDQGGDERQPKVLQKRFFEQGLAEVAKENSRTLAFTTTYALIFLVEVGSNQARKASSHLRLAADSLVTLDRTAYSQAAIEITTKGVHTLSAIHYHVAMCQLFRPVLEVVQLPETTRAHLYKITIQSALDGLQLLERYRSLYTNKYQNPLLAFCVVHICDLLVLAGGAKDVQQRAAQFALEATHESLAGFAYVGPLQYMFAKSIADEGVSLPEDVEELMGGRTRYGPEEMLDACERVTYTQPYKMLRDRMDRSLGVDFEREWKLFMETQGAGRSQWGGGTSLREAGLVARRSDSNSSSASGGSSARSMQIHSVVNP
ncbi:hypothetical protein SLS56_006967 [Neofusicoccum ribis]|uniref:Xylanolytic transcriptional activator regulatory domain-containing protein n=1 Tax=Neofusicoccum ribis TaxID=45134 RepID=A0ABR3SP91_9PEZI